MRVGRLTIVRGLIVGGALAGALLALEAAVRTLPFGERMCPAPVVWDHFRRPPTMPQVYNQAFAHHDLVGYERADLEEVFDRILERKVPGYKVLVVGDSITQFGHYVERLDDLLKSRYGAQAIEVINAGAMGYDPQLELAYLTHRGLRVEPDLVLLQIGFNDVQGTPLIVRQADGSWLAYDGVRRLNRLISPQWFAMSRLYQCVASRALNHARAKRAAPELKAEVQEPLREIAALLRHREIPMRIVMFPPFSDEPQHHVQFALLADIVRELSLESTTLDLSEVYAGAPYDRVASDGTHPNEAGGALAAAAMLEYLQPFLDAQLEPRVDLADSNLRVE